MDKSAAQRILDRELAPLMERLGISHWTISVDCDLKPEGDGNFRSRGECNWHIDYDKAAINFHPDAFEGETDVLKVLRHELFHVVSSPVSIFYNAVKPLLARDPMLSEMADSVFAHTVERLAINLERMYRGLTADAPAPAKRRKR